MRFFFLILFFVLLQSDGMAQATNGSCQTALEVVFNEMQVVVLEGAPSNGNMNELGVYFHFEGNGQVIHFSTMNSPRNAWITVKQSTTPCSQLTGLYGFYVNQPYEECLATSGYCGNRSIVFETVPGKHYYFLINAYAAGVGNASYSATIEDPVVGCLNPTACNYNPEANLYQACEWSSCRPLQEGETVISLHFVNPAPLDANGWSFCPTNFELTNSDSSFTWSQVDLTYLNYYNLSTSHMDILDTINDPDIIYSVDDYNIITRVIPTGCYTIHFPSYCYYNSHVQIRNREGEVLYTINPVNENGTFVCFDAIPGCTNPQAINFNEQATYEDASCVFFADINSDQVVDINDLQLMIDAMGCEGCDQIDLNDNGVVDVNDLILLIENMQ